MLINAQTKFNLFLNVLAQSKYGSISVYKDSKSIFSFKGDFPGPDANIKILKKRVLMIRGDLGWAESYVDGNWETSNLTDFLEWGARNFHEFSKYVRGKWFTILYLRLKHHLKK